MCQDHCKFCGLGEHKGRMEKEQIFMEATIFHDNLGGGEFYFYFTNEEPKTQKSPAAVE